MANIDRKFYQDPTTEKYWLNKKKRDVCPHCGGEYAFSQYCGVDVCTNCGYHKNLGRCFCGWNLRPGERLEDDIDY